MDRVEFPSEPTGAVAPESSTQTPQGDRPEWLPEKFTSTEDMAKAYKSLEAEYSKLKQGTVEVTPTDTPTTEPEVAQEPEVKNIEVPADLDVSGILHNFRTEGKLSEDQYAKIRSIYGDKLPQEYIDTYVSMYNAQIDGQAQEIFNSVGGKDSFDKMIGFANETYSEAEYAALDASINSDDFELAKQAVAALKAKYEASRGKTPQYVGGVGAAASHDVYTHASQIREDMRNPKYESDPTFREAVKAKIARSPNV